MLSDDPINEFLNRSDTAIIYPEPVSDQDEEDDNSHSGNYGNPIQNHLFHIYVILFKSNCKLSSKNFKRQTFNEFPHIDKQHFGQDG